MENKNSFFYEKERRKGLTEQENKCDNEIVKKEKIKSF
jgi:hypothetical protein